MSIRKIANSANFNTVNLLIFRTMPEPSTASLSSLIKKCALEQTTES